MYKDILLTITGIQLFPIISLILFVIVFSSILIAAGRMDGGRAARFSTLPFEDGTASEGSREVER
jgi:cytochrome c oxidase cbb3-type subunit 4